MTSSYLSDHSIPMCCTLRESVPSKLDIGGIDCCRLGLLLSAVIEFRELDGTDSGGGTSSAMFNIVE
jgi:hypothetical protein